MDIQSKIQQAIKQGYSMDEINQYMQQKGITGQPTQADTGQPSQQPQTTGGNGLLDFLLPTAGGIGGGALGALVPGLGETGVSEVAGASAGQAAGQYLSNLLQGRSAGQGVAGQAIGGAIGGGIGLGASKLLGGILGDLGENLTTGALNFTKGMLAKLKIANNGEAVTDTLLKHNLAGVDATGLQNGIDALGKQYSSMANDPTIPVDPQAFLNNVTNTIAGLRGGTPGSSKAMADAVEKEFQDNVLPKVADPLNPPTMADINKMKGEYDAQTTSAQFNADPGQWNVNRTVGQILRKTLNDSADTAGLMTPDGTPLSELGKNLMKLHNINDVAQNREGMGAGGALMSVTNLLLGGESAGAAALMGINPLAGAAVGLAGRKVLNNPLITRILSGAATGAGNAISGLSGAAGIAGALGGGALGAAVSGNPSQEQNQQNTSNNAQNNTSNGNVSQVDENGNYQLEPLGNAANRIPQSYPYENYIADQQKFANNPLAAEASARAYQASQQQAQEYASKFQLPAQEEAFMFNANNTNSQMNELRGLIQKEGTGLQNMAPPLVALKAYLDPQFGRMISLMTTLRSASEYNQAHGRLSNFDIQQLNNMPNVTDSKQTALAKLDANQKYLADKYKQNLPFYGLNTFLNSGVNQIQQQNNGQAGQINALPPQLQQVITNPLGISGQ